MFTDMLIIIAKKRKPKCPLTGEWIDKKKTTTKKTHNGILVNKKGMDY